MFAPRYFAPTYFAPRYWAPGFAELAEEVARTLAGGAPFFRRRKPRNFQHLLNFKGDTDVFEVEIEPIKVEETAISFKQEIARFESAIEIIQQQEAQAEAEIELLVTEPSLELQIRREILIDDLIAAREFRQDLQEQVIVLESFKRVREEEEMILAILMMDDDDMNITVH